MSALDAFYSTWDQARNTFGSGAPQTGAEFDRSSQLRDMQTAVQAATPDSRWQGSAADAYTAKNQQHAAVYGKLADLDQRMATEVDRSAAVVTAGRQNLDQIRDWVTSAAASAPNDKSGEYVKLAIASKGLGQISDIIQQSNNEMTAIGERVRGIGKEYDEIGGDDKKSALAGGKKSGWKQSPTTTPAPDPWEPTPDAKVAEWTIKFKELMDKIRRHNASKPPDRPEYAAQGKAWNQERDQLLKELGDLTREGSELGLDLSGIAPPTVPGGSTTTAPAGARGPLGITGPSGLANVPRVSKPWSV